MKSSHQTPSTTSLPPSPHDDAATRSMRYLVMMGVRIVCFILMVVITPYGWYTWVLGGAAIFLPYFAVVMANVSENVRRADPENPERALPSSPSAPPAPDTSTATVIRIEESRPLTSGQTPAEDDRA